MNFARDHYASELRAANDLFPLYEDTNPWPHFMRGIVHLNFRRMRLAADDLEAALQCGFQGSEIRIFTAAAQFRCGRLVEAVDNYREVTMNETGCVGNPHGLSAEFRAEFGKHMPLWRPPGKLLQRAVCYFFARAYTDADVSLMAVALVGRDHVDAGNDDLGEPLSWEHVVWRFANSHQLKRPEHYWFPDEELAMRERGGDGGYGAIPRQVAELYFGIRKDWTVDDEREMNASREVRRNFYVALYHDLLGVDGKCDIPQAEQLYRAVLDRVPEDPDEAMECIDDSAAFLVDVTRLRLKEVPLSRSPTT